MHYTIPMIDHDICLANLDSHFLGNLGRFLCLQVCDMTCCFFIHFEVVVVFDIVDSVNPLIWDCSFSCLSFYPSWIHVFFSFACFRCSSPAI